ncbi:MAG: hypothetical protein MSA39_01645 [Prevotella sp.]|nr:hypothetical protein [Prevotella sp.]
MLAGISENLMEEGKKKCEEKFKQELLGVWKDAAEYKIKTYDAFAYELRMLNDRYVDEMEDFEEFPSDIVLESEYDSIEKFKEKMSLQVYALGHLDSIYGIKCEVPLDTEKLAIPFQVIFNGK